MFYEKALNLGAVPGMHCKEDLNYVFPDIKLCGLVPNFHIHDCWDPIDQIFYRERASQPARNKRRKHWRRKVEEGLKAEGRRANMTRLSSVTPLPPPLTAPRICRTACGNVIRTSSPPPPPTPPSQGQICVIFSVLGQKARMASI